MIAASSHINLGPQTQALWHQRKPTKLWLSGNPDYNLVVRTPPFSERRAEWHHWHIEITPFFTKKSGFEVATQCNVLLTPPDVCARNLRDTNLPDAGRLASGVKRRTSVLMTAASSQPQVAPMSRQRSGRIRGPKE
jgi:hypothetical protein